jgi:hypothetical protein
MFRDFWPFVLLPLLVSCASPRPSLIPPTSDLLETPEKLGCTCTALTPEQLKHVVIIGDDILGSMLLRLNQCPQSPAPVVPPPSDPESSSSKVGKI